MGTRSQANLIKAILPLVLSGCAMSQSLSDRLPSFGKDRYSEQLLAARMAEQSGELLRARKSYEELLVKYPDNMDLHHRLGVLCQKAGDDAASISYLKMAHELSPTSVEVLCDLGYAHYIQGRADDAIAVYRQAQQINPSHPRTQSNLGLALIESGEVSAAMTTLRQAMGEADAASTVGFALAQKGDLLQAREYFTRALDADPTSQKAAEALVQIGELLAAENSAASAGVTAGTQPQVPADAAAGNASRFRPETVDFESLYSRKVEHGSSVAGQAPLSAATGAGADVNSQAAAAEATRSQVAGSQGVAGSFVGIEDGPVEKLLPPIESPEEVSRRPESRGSASGRALLSHTSLRLAESGGLAEFAEPAVENPVADIANFVESEPVDGVRSVESRRRSGGLIEPMGKAVTRSQSAPLVRQVSEKSLPPVEAAVSHGSHRKESSETIAAKSGNAAKSGAVEAAPAAVTNVPALPGAALQAVPQQPTMNGSSAGMQLVLIQDPAGRFYYVPMLMPPNTTAVPQVSIPAPPAPSPGVISTGIQPAGYQQTAESFDGYSQAIAAGLPQIYAHGQPVNQAVTGPNQMQPGMMQPGWGSTQNMSSNYAAGMQPPNMPQNAVIAQSTVSVPATGVPQEQYAPGVTGMSQMAAASLPGHSRAGFNAADFQSLARTAAVRQAGGPGSPALPTLQSAAVLNSRSDATPPSAAIGATPPFGNQQSAGAMSSAAASVGGLPLAFLRSFYAQMSGEQQAIFWRDLRKSGAGSPAERAAYRELAESSEGLARIEAAITMLMVFNEQPLAEYLLAQCADSADPTIQHSARTAMAMLPLRQAGRQ